MLLAGVAVAEVLGVVSRHWWSELFGSTAYLNQLAATFAVCLAVFSGRRILSEVAGAGAPARFPWWTVVLQGGAYALFVWLTIGLVDGGGRTSRKPSGGTPRGRRPGWLRRACGWSRYSP